MFRRGFTFLLFISLFLVGFFVTNRRVGAYVIDNDFTGENYSTGTILYFGFGDMQVDIKVDGQGVTRFDWGYMDMSTFKDDETSCLNYVGLPVIWKQIYEKWYLDIDMLLFTHNVSLMERYDLGYNDGVNATWTDAYYAGKAEGITEGYDNGKDEGYILGRTVYGIESNGVWYGAKEWGDYRYEVGQSEDFNFFDGLVSLLFSSITAFGNIEILPGFRLSFFVGIVIVFGLIFFIIGKRGGGKD